MKIAVIGANGLVGSRLVEQLHLAGEHTVIPIVRGPMSLARSARFNVEWRLADALEGPALRAALQGCDAVVHAGAGADREIERLPVTLCTAAAAVGIRRVVYLSCASVHGPTPEPGTSEHTPLHTTRAPKETAHRIMAERAFFQQCARRDLEGIALRPGMVYGPRSPWFATLAAELREGRAWWFGDGRGIFNGIYVDNLTSAIFSALAAPASAAGKPYLVGDAETITWREVYLALAGAIGASARRITSVTQLPPGEGTARSRLRFLADAPGLKAVAPVVPTRMKRLARYVFSDTPTPSDGWTSPPVAPGVEITLERALQQQCRWRFPHKRAARALGFRAPVAFAEALKRSVAWLAFVDGEPARNGDANAIGTNGTRTPFRTFTP
jgi:2-alkyl-3-oxoalkanoate reductase